jgi:hypothetical protein
MKIEIMIMYLKSDLIDLNCHYHDLLDDLWYIEDNYPNNTFGIKKCKEKCIKIKKEMDELRTRLSVLETFM